MNGRHVGGKSKPLAVLVCFTVLFALGFFVLFFHGDYPGRILTVLGLRQTETVSYAYKSNDKAIAGWDRCLEQLGVKADVVFFGDSITHQSDFASFFPDVAICNLGIGSDTLQGMRDRVFMVKTVSPRKVFLMGGINSLTDDDVDDAVAEYDHLLSDICASLDGAEIYVISVLPISEEAEARVCGNDTILLFNQAIEKLAEDRGITYIDLHARLLLDGSIDPQFTTDGVHLTDAAYSVWADSIAEYLR